MHILQKTRLTLKIKPKKMNHMFNCKFLAAATLMLGLCVPAMAENTSDDGLDYKPAPYMFIGLQGGAQTTFSKNYDNLKLITPTASFSFGAFFTPVVGARLHFNGIWNKGGYDENGLNFKYDYKYMTTNLDLMINLVNLFSKRCYSKWNVYLISGFGLNTAWGNDDAYANKQLLPLAYEGTRFSHNIRVGAMLDYNIAKHWSVNLEVSGNSLSDRYNSKTSAKDDWQLTAQIGLAYKFGFKKNNRQQEPVAQRVAPQKAAEKPATAATAAAAATTAAAVTAQKAAEKTATAAAATAKAEPVKPVVKPEMRTEFFYEIRETVISKSEKAKFDQLVKFLKENPDTKVSVVGYADAGTGNDEINARYARQRADNVVKALKNAGIDGKRISSDSKGDDIQPYRENDKNRVVIAVAK